MDNKIYITINKETGIVERIDDVRLIADDGFMIVERDGDIKSDDVFEYFDQKYVNGEFISDTELIEENKKNNLRDKRASLLEAFDRYKTNLIIKAIEISDEEQAEIIAWYHSVLDLDENSINNPPEKITYYIN
jgi:hypothetical protein